VLIGNQIKFIQGVSLRPLKSGGLFEKHVVATNGIKFVFSLTSAGKVIIIGVVTDAHEVDAILTWSIDNRPTLGELFRQRQPWGVWKLFAKIVGRK
jgi:hypothetical protein